MHGNDECIVNVRFGVFGDNEKKEINFNKRKTIET